MFESNHFVWGIIFSKNLIKAKLKTQKNTVFAIVQFSKQAKTVLGFTDDIEKLFNALESIKLDPQEIKNIGNALFEAMKLILKEIKSKEMIFVPRIVIVSDIYCTSPSSNILEVAKYLNIKIDTIRIGKLPVNKHLRRKNDLKVISNATDGRFFSISDIESLKNTELKIIRPNIKNFSTDLASNLKSPKFLRKIAADLLRVQDLTRDYEQKIMQIRGVGDYDKCLICFSHQNPYTKGSFYVTGRYCPNCHAPFHIHCLAAWVESQKNHQVKRSGTARCPHCFYLLKIPHGVLQMLNLKQLSDPNISRKVISHITVQAELTNISNLGDKAIYASCSICDNIFEENQRLVQCVCGRLYHFDCFQKLRNGQCRDCGVKLKL